LHHKDITASRTAKLSEEALNSNKSCPWNKAHQTTQ